MNGKLNRLKIVQLIVMLVVSISFIFIIVGAISRYEVQHDLIETDRIEETVKKYAIQCYATEGAYPPNLEYLVVHYGLILNEDKYRYEYEAVAENIKPIIKVSVKIGYGED